MQKLLDKLLLFGLCLLPLLFEAPGNLQVTALLASIIASALCSYFEKRARPLLCVVFCALSLWRMEFLYFLPLLTYDGMEEPWYIRFAWIIPLLWQAAVAGLEASAATLLFSLCAMLLWKRTADAGYFHEQYHLLEDATREQSLFLERKNRELMEKQDYEIRLATLDERNRISREIHDNVGHLLTRSLLQVSALQVVFKEESLSEGLAALKESLSDAMDNIRRSVHGLHDESIDLRMQLQAVLKGFSFCPVKFRYDAGELPRELKYCMIAVVREALNNIAKHSTATEASVTLLEHPALYQLIVEDNGTAPPKESGPGGIGLINMKDRVDSFGGVFRAESLKNRGFRVFLSIPKEGKLS